MNREIYCKNAIKLYQGDENELDIDIITSKPFVDFCQEHRILSRMEKRLMPYFPTGELRDYFISQLIASRARALKQLSVLQDIAEAFNGHNITWLAFKGPVLSHVLFDDATLRASKDLDIWVPHSELHKAHNILVENSFLLTSVSQKSRESRLHAFCEKDDIYIHQITGVQLELHWNLISGANFTDAMILGNKKTISFYQHDIPVFNSSMEFIYLCAHAGKSHWKRLSWLFDVYDYYQKIPLDENMLFTLASQYQWDNYVRHGLYVMHHFFKKTRVNFIGNNKMLGYINKRKVNVITKSVEMSDKIGYFLILKRTLEEVVLSKSVRIFVIRVLVFVRNHIKIN